MSSLTLPQIGYFWHIYTGRLYPLSFKFVMRRSNCSDPFPRHPRRDDLFWLARSSYLFIFILTLLL